jgi:hypothetical protein
MVSLVAENFPRKAPEMKVSYLAGSPKPRVVKLSIKPDGEDTFRLGGVNRRSSRFNIHIEIGGIAGVIAPVIGKTAIRHQSLGSGWRSTRIRQDGRTSLPKRPNLDMELTSPVWPQNEK